MTPEEARSLGRAIRVVRLERGLSQLKLAVAAGFSAGQVGIGERGSVPGARGRAEYAPKPLSSDEVLPVDFDHVVRALSGLPPRLIPAPNVACSAR